MARSLSVVDFVIFGLFLLFSSFIGIYHSFRSKQNSTRDYILAGKTVTWFPLFVSLLATYLSAISLLGIPSEVYTYEAQYGVIIFSFPVAMTLVAFVYAPIFYRLKITSANEYLQRRFSPGMRLVGTCLILTQLTFYLSIVLYAPSLALEAVAGVPLAASIVSTGLVCNFYTTLGGMKAVIWTDVFQAFMMLVGLIIVIVTGTMETGGLSNVIDIAKAGKRMTFFDFNPDPTHRNNFWALTIGGTFLSLPIFAANQTMIQRVLSAKSLKQAQGAVMALIFGLSLIVSMCVLAGLVMYSVYAQCDIKTINEVTSNDQVLAYFIISKLSHLKGVPGIFTACLFSGSLSTASSGLNSIAAVFVDDVLKRFKPNLSDKRTSTIMKITACCAGFIVIGGAFLIQYLGAMILQLAQSLAGIVSAPYCGLFSLGMLTETGNWQGAYAGIIVGVVTTIWLALGGIMYPPNKYPGPTSIERCYEIVGVKTNSTGFLPYQYEGYNFPTAKFYSVSYLWYGVVGFGVTFVTGYIVSYIVKCLGYQQMKKIDPELLFHKSEVLRCWRKSEEEHENSAEQVHLTKDEEAKELTALTHPVSP